MKNRCLGSIIVLVICATTAMIQPACSQRQSFSSANAPKVASIKKECCVTSRNASAVENEIDSSLFPVSQRKTLNLNYHGTGQDGKAICLAEFIGQPVVISFMYTSCTNPLKCQRVTRSMAELQKKITGLGLQNRIKLILISYDPIVDTPAVLSKYASRFDVSANENMLLFQPEGNSQLYSDLDAAVSFNPGGVTMHDIQLLLVDKNGKLARRYSTLIWNNDKVIEDLKILITE